MKSPKKRNPRLKSNKRKTQANQNGVSYDPLEPRQLLATDFGLNLTGASFGSETNDLISDVAGDSSADHVIQAVNGHFGIYDRIDGVRVHASTLENFFISTGATLFDDLENPQIVFDADSQRWFAAAQGEGAGNWIHVAFTNTSDPTGVWQQLQFAADSTGTHYNDDLSMFVDEDAVYFSTNNHFFGNVDDLADNVSLYSIPKSDMFGADPTLTNMSRFEELATDEYGVSLQVAATFEDTDEPVVVIGKMPWEHSFLATITRSDLSGAEAAGATLSEPTNINLELNPFDPFFRPARAPFQPGDAIEGGPDERVLSKDNYRISVAAANGKLLGAHTVLFDDKDDDTPNRNVVQWFEIDLDTNEFIISDSRLNSPFAWAQNNIITTPLGDAFNVSMDMNDYGVVVVNYNASGNEITDEGINRFIGYHSAVAMSANGLNSRTTQFENFEVVQAGLDNFLLPPLPTPWTGFGTVRLDSSDPYSSFWGFQSFANTNDRWSAQLVNLLPNDMTVIVEANEFQNEFWLRRNAEDPNLLEIEIDGVVTDLLPYAALGTVELRGYEGNDTFWIDYTNGDPVPEGGFHFNGGAGPDAIKTNSPEGVRYVSDINTGGTYNETSSFISVEELYGWTGDDSFRFERRDIFNTGFLAGSAHGLGGDDTFEFADDATIGDSINGGTGYNTLSFFDRAFSTEVVTFAGAQEMGVDGRTIGAPIGGDQALDQFRDISNLIGGELGGDRWSVADEMDSTWFIDDENSFYTIDGVHLDFSYWDVIDATTHVDTFNVLSSTLPFLVLNGLEGNDVYNFSSNAPTNTGTTAGITGVVHANAGLGENLMFVSNEGGDAADALVLSRRISGMGEIVYDAIGGSFDLELIGSEFDDIFSLHSFIPTNTLLVESRAGNDYFSIQDLSKADVTVRGQVGDDTYAVEMIQGVSFRNLVIEDSIDAEMDRVIIVGTVLDEVFTITDTTFDDLEVLYSGIENFGIEGRGGNDVFNIISNSSDLEIKGEGGDDIFNFASDAPANAGDMSAISGNVVVDGGEGINQMNLINRGGPAVDMVINSSRITGLLADDGVIDYLATGGSFGLRESDGFGGIRITGSEVGNDVMTVNGVGAEHWVQLMGLGGNDQFYVRAATAADVWAGGGEGNDQYHVFIGAGSRNVTLFENSIGDKNRIEYYGTDSDDTISIAAASLQSGGDMVTTQGDFQFLRVVGYAGHDNVTYNMSPALVNHYLGGEGMDTLNIDGSAGMVGFRAVGDAGVDTFNLNDVDVNTFIRGIGGDGADIFNVTDTARGKVSLDGQQGNDTYNVWLMRNGARQVDTRDSVDGFDVTNVIGSEFIDAVEVRATRIITGDQRIGYGNTIEQVEIHTGNGDDTVDVFATVTPEMIIRMGAGADTVLVSGTTFAQSLKIYGGGDSDTMTVKKTQETTNLELHGQGSADTFNIGSSISKDNGNLGKIRGAVVVAADNSLNTDANGDWLYLNDNGVTGPYSYGITPNGVESIPGPRNIDRPQFGGVMFNGTLDSLRLDGTSKGNHFSVTPSIYTAMFFDGNDPDTGLASADSITLESGDGNLTITDAEQGNGYWEFNGNSRQRVDFINMEVWDEGGQASPLAGNSFNADDDDNGFGRMMMANYAASEVYVQASSLAGMQTPAQDDLNDEKESFLKRLDASVEEFDFDFEIV